MPPTRCVRGRPGIPAHAAVDERCGGTQPMTASLSRRMHVSVQAASEMVSRLSADGLVEVDPTGAWR